MPHEDAVDLFWKGGVFVTAAQASFEMCNMHLLVETCESAGECSTRITLDDHGVWLFGENHSLKTGQRVGNNIRKRLIMLHDIEVMVFLDLEKVQYLCQHFFMLGGHANHSFKGIISLKRLNKRRHLNGLGARTKDEKYFHAFLFKPSASPTTSTISSLYLPARYLLEKRRIYASLLSFREGF